MRIFYFCLSLLLLHSVSGLTYKVHEIFDLEYTSSDFVQEATYWNSSSLLSSTATQYCDGYPLLGGYGATGPNTVFSRNYTNLPSHSLAVFMIKFWLFGHWRSTDYITVSITSPQVNYKKAILKIKYDQNLWDDNVCGIYGLYGYKYARLMIGTPYLGSSVKIEVQASQTSNYIYFGLRHLKISFLNYASNILDYCLVTHPSSLTLDSPCWFDETTYQVNNNYYPCDSSCSICASGSSSGCLSCKDNYINNGLQCVQCNSACYNCYGLGSNQCTSCKSGSFLYSSNSTCMNQCVAPYVQKSQNGVNYCNYPCDDPSKFAYTNGSCLSTCPASFIQKSYDGGAFKTCSFPCSSNSYLFSNGSCINSCNTPLQVIYQGGNKYCNYQCSASQYLYLNGSCLGDCPLPFQITSDVNDNKFCLNSCSNNYFYWNGSCLATCPSPFLQTTQSGSKFCNFPCDSNEFFSSWNNSCLSSCNSPLIQRQGSVSGENYCDLPCSSLSEYFYDNSTCSNSCNSPYIATTEPQSGANLCQSPCSLNKYLYPDGLCLPTPCTTPYMTKTTQDGINFCIFKCSTTLPYLYPNDSCSSQCSQPFSVRNESRGISFCDPTCASTEYWSTTNSSCQDSCQSPFVIRRESSINYCDFPCTSNQYFFVEKDVCTDSCPQPFVIKDKYCEKPCNDSAPYYYSTDNTCKSTCIDPYYPTYQDGGYFTCGAKNSIVNLNEARSATMKAAAAGLIASTVISGGSPGAVTIAIFAKMFEYLKFMDIGYSQSLKLVMETWRNDFISLGLEGKMSTKTKNDFTTKSAPPIFRKWDLEPSFFLNFWDQFVILLIISGVILALLAAEWALKKYNYPETTHNISRKVRILAQNFLILILYQNFGDIFLFSALEYGSLSFNAKYSALSFLLSLVFISITVFVLVKHYQILKKRQKFRKTTSPEDVQIKLLKDYEYVQILFKDFKDQFFSQQAFLFFFTLRDIAFRLIIAVMYAHPLAEALLITILSVIILAYMLIKRPFRETIDEAQEVTYEVFILIVNMSILIMAILDAQNSTVSATRERLSNLIICINLVFNLAACLFMFSKFILEAIELWKHYKLRKEAKKIAPGLLAINVIAKKPNSPLKPKPKNKLMPIKKAVLLSEEGLKDNTDGGYTSDNLTQIISPSQKQIDNNTLFKEPFDQTDSIIFSEGESKVDLSKLDHKLFKSISQHKYNSRVLSFEPIKSNITTPSQTVLLKPLGDLLLTSNFMENLESRASQSPDFIPRSAHKMHNNFFEEENKLTVDSSLLTTVKKSDETFPRINLFKFHSNQNMDITLEVDKDIKILSNDQTFLTLAKKDENNLSQYNEISFEDAMKPIITIVDLEAIQNNEQNEQNFNK